jgi:hypothetical protein
MYYIYSIPNHACREATGSNSSTRLTLLWACNPFRGNFNHWQVSQEEIGEIFFKRQRQILNINTGYEQKKGAVSKVNKKFISHPTRAQRTPSAAATVQVSHALITMFLSTFHSRMKHHNPEYRKQMQLHCFELKKSMLHLHGTFNSL